jgi:ABC-type sugar transport system ATPase subunit
LGEASLIYVDISGHDNAITVRVDGTTRETVGQAVHVVLPEALIHVFDSTEQACDRTVYLPG